MRTPTLVVLLPISTLLGLAVGCGDDNSTPDRVAAVCGRIVDASCAKFVECKVMENGTVLTASVCDQVRSNAVANCQSSEGANIAAGSDADIDACVQELGQVQCSSLCGQIPQDPPTCHKLSPSPNTHTIVCAQ